jgi:hypothetical protein
MDLDCAQKLPLRMEERRLPIGVQHANAAPLILA